VVEHLVYTEFWTVSAASGLPFVIGSHTASPQVKASPHHAQRRYLTCSDDKMCSITLQCQWPNKRKANSPATAPPMRSSTSPRILERRSGLSQRLSDSERSSGPMRDVQLHVTPIREGVSGCWLRPVLIMTNPCFRSIQVCSAMPKSVEWEACPAFSPAVLRKTSGIGRKNP